MAPVDTAPDSFGAALRQLRERAGFTQERLAETAGLSANAISALERGERRRPYPDTIDRLATALKLTDTERAALAGAVARQRKPARSRPAGPRQLPAAVRDFTGRAGDLARLDALLDQGGTARSVLVTTITGTAGVGKTTLAVRWAHRVRDRFPDGQLYVNLRGYDPGPPAEPAAVLDGFLRALEVPADQIPPTVEQRSALFRSRTDDRRLLVVLDNARSEEQVRPLLPGSPSSMVVVTSRASLTGLAVGLGAVRVGLDLLPVRDAVALLRTVVGGDRTDAEPDAVADLVERCARLPLALQLVAQRAAARPHVPLAELAAELTDEADRLELLSCGSDEFTAVRPVFSWSYHRLATAQAHLFAVLGLHPGPDLGGEAAAALAAVSPARARRQLDDLVEAHLVERAGPD